MKLLDYRPAELEQKLRARIRFLLPPPLAILLMVGLAGVFFDIVVSPRPMRLVLIAEWICMEAGLVLNIVARHKAQRRLNRLLTHHCPECGAGVVV